MQILFVLWVLIFQISINLQRKTIKMSNNRFQYQLARDQQIHQLRGKCQQLFEQNETLKRSLQQLIKVNSELTQSIQQFNNMNIGNMQYDNKSSNKGQNAQDMQNKIDMLTMQVQMLRADVGNGQHSNQGQDNEVIMNMVEQMLESFKNVQMKYENEITDLRDELRNYQNQWASILIGIQNKSHQKFRSFDQVIQQLKTKDEIVLQIQNKIKNIENSAEPFTNIQQISGVNNSQIDQIKAMYEQQIQEKNKTIQAYKQLIVKLKKKLAQKY